MLPYTADYVPNPPTKLQAPALRGEKVSLGGSKKLGNGARGQEGMKFPDSRSDFILGQIHKATYMELHGSDTGKGGSEEGADPQRCTKEFTCSGFLVQSGRSCYFSVS